MIGGLTGWLKRALMRLKRLCVVVLVLSILAVGAATAWSYHWLTQPLLTQEHHYQLAPGGSLGRVVYDLAHDQILPYPRLLLAYAKLTQNTSVRAGEYRFPVGASPMAILQQLQAGDVVQYSVTLVEGWTFQQAVEHLSEQPKLQSMLQGLDVERQLQHLDIDVKHPEGWFFPDTYRYVAGTTDVDILRRAYQQLTTTLHAEWNTRAANLPYQSAYDALIMASIIEKETGAPHERPDIAGVFIRRLQQGMRLQTDPTIIYGLGDSYDGNIRRRHLRQKTPYNTYMISGLPPTPIALVGREAIHAAMHPNDGQALYFVAKGDGSHQFSATLEEHNRAVQRYQRRQRAENYRSSPP